MRLHRLAIIAVFVWIPVTQAATIVWFEAVQLTPFTGTCGQGPGQTLLLCYPEGLTGVLSWQVSMKAALGPGGIVQWSLDLKTAPGNGVSIVNPQIPSGSPFNFETGPGTPGSGPSLLQAAHGTNFVGVQPQTLTLLTFTMRRTVPLGDFTSANVYGGPSINSTWVWANGTTGDYEVVQFGPNPAVPAIEGTVGALPLIRLFPYPEPSSLTLLAMGGVVCLRRGRSECRNKGVIR